MERLSAFLFPGEVEPDIRCLLAGSGQPNDQNQPAPHTAHPMVLQQHQATCCRLRQLLVAAMKKNNSCWQLAGLKCGGQIMTGGQGAR